MKLIVHKQDVSHHFQRMTKETFAASASVVLFCRFHCRHDKYIFYFGIFCNAKKLMKINVNRRFKTRFKYEC